MSLKNDFIAHLLFQKGAISLPVYGNSMFPTIKQTDTITVEPVDNTTLEPGGCYIFLSEGSLVVHRMFFSIRNWVFVAGDNNPYMEKILRDNIIGRAILHESPVLKNMIMIITFLFVPLHTSLLFTFRRKCIRLIFMIGGYCERLRTT